MFVLVPFSVRIPEGLRAERRQELSLYGGLTGVVVRLWETANGYYQYLTNRNHTTVPTVSEVSPGTVCTSQLVTQDTPWILLPKCPWLERCGSIILWSFLVSSHFLRFNSPLLFFLWSDCLGIRVSYPWSHQLRIKSIEKQLSSVLNTCGLSVHRGQCRQYSLTIYKYFHCIGAFEVLWRACSAPCKYYGILYKGREQPPILVSTGGPGTNLLHRLRKDCVYA